MSLPLLVALESHRKEGGVTGRGARYTKNQNALVSGMRSIGFETLLGERWLSPIIVTFFVSRSKFRIYEVL